MSVALVRVASAALRWAARPRTPVTTFQPARSARSTGRLASSGTETMPVKATSRWSEQVRSASSSSAGRPAEASTTATRSAADRSGEPASGSVAGVVDTGGDGVPGEVVTVDLLVVRASAVAAAPYRGGSRPAVVRFPADSRRRVGLVRDRLIGDCLVRDRRLRDRLLRDLLLRDLLARDHGLVRHRFGTGRARSVDDVV